MWYFGKDGKPAQFVRKATSTDIKGNESFGDRELIKNTIKDLPKLKDDATRQSRNIQTLDKALAMVKTGTVTGKGGQVKAFIQPYAEAMGVNTQGMDDAQTFNLLTRVITGPMRLDLIGAGPVSEYEQKLMKEMSGGGATGQAAAYELLTYYKGVAKDKVNTYNQTLEGAISLDSTIGRIHKPIKVQDDSPGNDTASPGAKPGTPAKPMQSLPPASQHKGRVIIDTTTGRKLKSDGANWIEASAGNPQLAQVTADSVPLGSGMAEQSKSLIQLRKELNQAYLNGDDARAQEIERMIQQITAQQKNVG